MHQCLPGQRVATVSSAVPSAKKDRWVVAVLPSPLTHHPLPPVFLQAAAGTVVPPGGEGGQRGPRLKATPLLQVGDATLRRRSTDPPVQLRWGELPHLRSERGALGPPPGAHPESLDAQPGGGRQPEVGDMPRPESEQVPRPGPLAYPRQHDSSRPLTTHTCLDGRVGSPGSGSVLRRRGRARPLRGSISAYS